MSTDAALFRTMGGRTAIRTEQYDSRWLNGELRWLLFSFDERSPQPSVCWSVSSSRARVCADPADPRQRRKERPQTLLLFPREELGLERRGEPQRLGPGGKSVSGEPNVKIYAAFSPCRRKHVLSRDPISFLSRMMKEGRSPW